MPTSFQIQDLAKLCSEHFEPRANQHCRVVNDATCRWVDEYGFLEEEERARLPDMQIALLAAMCFPTCDMPQLKTAEDLLMILFHWQDKPERVDEAADQAAFQNVWDRLRRTTSEDWQSRFQIHLAQFCSAQRARATVLRNRMPAPLPTVETCLLSKRSSEPFNLAFLVNEYAEGLNLDASLLAGRLDQLRMHAVDAVIWMKDIVSYNVQQAKGDPDNLISVLMAQHQVTLQAAVGQAVDALRKDIQSFVNTDKNGTAATMSRDGNRYIQGLRDWVVGWAHWVYETNRYFGKSAEDVKAFGWVFLLPTEED